MQLFASSTSNKIRISVKFAKKYFLQSHEEMWRKIAFLENRRTCWNLQEFVTASLAGIKIVFLSCVAYLYKQRGLAALPSAAKGVVASREARAARCIATLLTFYYICKYAFLGFKT